MRLQPLLIALGASALIVSIKAPALAQSTAASEHESPASIEDSEDGRNPFTKGVRVYFGRTKAQDDQGLENPSDDTTVGVEFGDRLPGTGGYLAYDVGLWLSFRDYENALDAALGITDPQIDANWAAITGGLRITVPRQTAFRFYGIAGTGIFRSILSSSGPGVVGEVEDRDTGIGGYAGVGLEYNWPGWGLGLDLRRLWVPADFDDFGLDDVDLGGIFAGLVVRKKF